jgi:hypothetical protein
VVDGRKQFVFEFKEAKLMYSSVKNSFQMILEQGTNRILFVYKHAAVMNSTVIGIMDESRTQGISYRPAPGILSNVAVMFDPGTAAAEEPAPPASDPVEKEEEPMVTPVTPAADCTSGSCGPAVISICAASNVRKITGLSLTIQSVELSGDSQADCTDCNESKKLTPFG